MATGTAQWREVIYEASQETGVPRNLIESIMRVESQGVWNAVSPSGAVGLMQIMPQYWAHLGDIYTPQGNVSVGAKILAHLQEQHGPKGPRGWDRAICAYFTGQPEPRGASDPFSTDWQYIDKVNQAWADIERETQGQHALTGLPASASVVSDLATLLQEPMQDAEVVSELQVGDVVELTGANSGDYLPVTSKDHQGYIHRGYLTARVAEQLKVRSTPSLIDESNVVGTLPPGETVRFMGDADIGFVGIEWNGGRAFVFREYIETPAVDVVFPTAGVTTSVKDTVNVRRTPTLRSNENVIGTLVPGDTVTLTGDATVGFVSIAWEGGRASVYAEFLAAGTAAPRTEVDSDVEGTEVTVVESGVRLRSAPDTSDANNILIQDVPQRATVALTGRAENGFMSVLYDEQKGWISAQFLRARILEPGVRLRSAPDPSDSTNILVDGMDAGAAVALTGQVEQGFVSVDYRGQEGWAAARYLGKLPDLAAGGNWLKAIYGTAEFHISQPFGNMTGPPLYQYGLAYCLDGQAHPGVDVVGPHECTLYAPMGGTITCAGTGVGRGYDGGGCAAFQDTGDGGPNDPVQGVGRIELWLDDGSVLIYGHSRQCFHPPGTYVRAGDPVGTQGGMYGSHGHFERRVRDINCRSGWRCVDPAELFEE